MHEAAQNECEWSCVKFDAWTADKTEAKIEVTDELNVESRQV